MAQKKEQYFEGVGRRKESIARVRIESNTKDNSFVVNTKECKDYFSTEELMLSAKAPLEILGVGKNFFVSAKVSGGGLTGQAEAVQLGLARALVKFDGEFQRALRDADFLKRDPRSKERKKAGLKKARKSPQWSKR